MENTDKDYILENERRKKAFQKENQFLKDEVLDKGSRNDKNADFQNEQTDMEEGIEKNKDDHL